LLVGRRYSVDLFEDFFELALIHSRPPSECVQLLDPGHVPSTEKPPAHRMLPRRRKAYY
jgi:hypothetical protein